MRTMRCSRNLRVDARRNSNRNQRRLSRTGQGMHRTASKTTNSYAESRRKAEEINSAYQCLPQLRPKPHKADLPARPTSTGIPASVSCDFSPNSHQSPRTSHFNSSLRTKRPANRKRLAVTLAVLLAVEFRFTFGWPIASPVTDDSRTQTKSGTAGPLARE